MRHDKTMKPQLKDGKHSEKQCDHVVFTYISCEIPKIIAQYPN